MPAETCDFAFAITHTAAGGLREIWNDVASGLEARGYQVAKLGLYRAHDPAGAPSGDAEGWCYLADEPRASALTAIRILFRAIAWLRRVRPKVVVSAMPLANVLWPVAVALARVRTKVVITHHSPVETHNKWLNRLDSLTGQLYCVTRIVSVSNAVGASLGRKPSYYLAKRQTIHNALPARVEARLEGLWQRRRDQGRRQQGMLHVVALGRLSYQKNYPLVIKALANAPNVRLSIAGGGEDADQLHELAEQCKVSGRVDFLGHVSREEALEVLAQADVFVQVSHYEGHSLALIEAARLGVPLVVSNVPVQVEGITHGDGRLCGIVVPVDKPAELAGVLNSLDRSHETQDHWAGLARMLGLSAANAAMVDAYESLLATGSHEADLTVPVATSDPSAR